MPRRRLKESRSSSRPRRRKRSSSEHGRKTEKSPSRKERRKNSNSGANWICSTCAGPHRSRECPLQNSSAPSVNPLMGMMGFMGMPSMGVAGMPPIGVVMPGMMTRKEGKKRKSRERHRRKARSSKSSEDSRSFSSARRSRSRGRRRIEISRSVERERSPEAVHIEEVDRFLEDNNINEEASEKIRKLSPASQRRVISRPLTGDVQNPSKVMICRVRELLSQAEKAKGHDIWNAWNGAMANVPVEVVEKYIKDNDLDESASVHLRSLPPQQQAFALTWDLSQFRNPSAKFVSMVNNLAMRSLSAMPMMPGPPPNGLPFLPGGPPSMPPGMMPMIPGFPMGGPMPQLSLGASTGSRIDEKPTWNDL